MLSFACKLFKKLPTGADPKWITIFPYIQTPEYSPRASQRKKFPYVQMQSNVRQASWFTRNTALETLGNWRSAGQRLSKRASWSMSHFRKTQVTPGKPLSQSCWPFRWCKTHQPMTQRQHQHDNNRNAGNSLLLFNCRKYFLILTIAIFLCHITRHYYFPVKITLAQILFSRISAVSLAEAPIEKICRQLKYARRYT